MNKNQYRAGSGPHPTGPGVVGSMKTVAAGLLLGITPMAGYAQLPAGAQVESGRLHITQPSATTMHINQSSDRAVINWNTFNVGADKTVQFNQPGANSQTLNRVVGGLPSNIQGKLLANGQVFIVNPNGVLFSKGSVINTGALLATTKNIDSSAFMAGRPLTLSDTGKQGEVRNDGAIQTSGGVTLIADRVRNTGSITGNSQVALIAAGSAQVSLANGQLVGLTLTGSTPGALVENTGHIQTTGQATILAAANNTDLLSNAVNLGGIVRAGSLAVTTQGSGSVAVSAQVEATSGPVIIEGHRVALRGANIKSGGGRLGLSASNYIQLRESQVTSSAGALNVDILAPIAWIDASRFSLGGGTLTATATTPVGGTEFYDSPLLVSNSSFTGAGDRVVLKSPGSVGVLRNQFEMAGGSLNISGGSATLKGDVIRGVQVAHSTLSKLSDVDIRGAVDGTSAGVYIWGGTKFENISRVRITGTGNTGQGVYMGADTDKITFRDIGQLYITGTSNSQVGVDMQNVNLTRANGTILGKSGTSTGINLGTLHIDQQYRPYTVSLDGASRSGNGVAGKYLLQDTGVLWQGSGSGTTTVSGERVVIGKVEQRTSSGGVLEIAGYAQNRDGTYSDRKDAGLAIGEVSKMPAQQLSTGNVGYMNI